MKEYIAKHKLSSLICLLFMLLEAVHIFLKVYVIQLVIEVAIGNENRSLIDLILLSLFVLIFGALCRILSKRFQNNLVSKIVHEIRSNIFRNIIYSSKSSFENEVILPALTTELLQVEDDHIRRVFQIVGSSVIFVSVTIFILNIHIWVGLAICLLSLVPLIAPAALGKRAAARRERYSKANTKFIDSLKDIVNGLETIKAFGIADNVYESIKQDIANAESEFSSLRKLTYLIRTIAEAALLLLRVVILVMLGFLALNGIIAVGVLIALIEMVDSYLQRTDELILNINHMRSVRPALNKIINLAKKGFDDADSKKLGEFDCINFDNVKFGYDSDDFCLDINYNFIKGKKYLIVGKSGSGKSTILKLLAKEETPVLGTISVGGISLTNIDFDDWFRHVSLIEQDVFLFNASLMQNIDITQTGDTGRAEHALKLVNLSRFADGSDGHNLKSELGDNGQILSGGERQRIAIARAIFKGGDIFLADEVTSSLDNKTASEIEDILINTAETLIMVSHRIAYETASKFDEILVIDNGSIAENGSFEELISKQGIFYNLYHFVNDEGVEL